MKTALVKIHHKSQGYVSSSYIKTYKSTLYWKLIQRFITASLHLLKIYKTFSLLDSNKFRSFKSWAPKNINLSKYPFSNKLLIDFLSKNRLRKLIFVYNTLLLKHTTHQTYAWLMRILKVNPIVVIISWPMMSYYQINIFCKVFQSLPHTQIYLSQYVCNLMV